MGKSRNRNRGRGVSATTRRSRLLPRNPVRLRPWPSVSLFGLPEVAENFFSDFRRFANGPRFIQAGEHVVSPVTESSGFSYAPGAVQLGSKIYRAADLCARRKTRREVIFARGGGGKGFRHRKPRRNQNSDLRC